MDREEVPDEKVGEKEAINCKLFWNADRKLYCMV